ncbi:MAG: PmoA family protein [Prolixibacteraceae bacterium]|nr:PmoA family protein [Prolixibacteraceae bacterium]
MRTLFLISIIAISSLAGVAQSIKQVQKNKDLKIAFLNREADKKVDVMIDGKLFTSYCWFDNVFKPVLYPVCTSAGTEITRGFPLKQRAGERADHPHQIGMWFTYGNVDGNDFWGNGSRGLGTKNANGGTIKHVKVNKVSGGNGEGVLVTTESWLDSTGNSLLTENSKYHFIAKGPTRIIDRITTLTANGKTVYFKDTKEGMLGIRVARQLELPSNENVTLTDAKGNPTTVKAMTNEGVSGNYISSEGIKGDAVWGTRARWMELFGNIGNEKISVVVCDHPRNQSYPTYWHARGYGLFAANPLGLKDFTKGKEELNFSISKGKSTTFRYRLIVSSGAHLTVAGINDFADDFSRKYK